MTSQVDLTSLTTDDSWSISWSRDAPGMNKPFHWMESVRISSEIFHNGVTVYPGRIKNGLSTLDNCNIDLRPAKFYANLVNSENVSLKNLFDNMVQGP
jgi:hypothetical protein